jgi:hypothetical protein
MVSRGGVASAAKDNVWYETGSNAIWKEMQKAFKSLDYERSKAHPCLYSCWTDNWLFLWLTWVNDCLIAGERRREDACDRREGANEESDRLWMDG